MGNKALKKIRWPLLFAAALLLSGCPYGSDFPLGSHEEAVEDVELLGTWRSAGEQDEQDAVIIQATGDRRLLLSSAEAGEQEPESIQAFVSEVDGERFLNIHDEELYFFAQYSIRDDRLRLRIVGDELFEGKTFTSTEELQAFVRASLSDPRLYLGEDWEVELVRQ